MDKSGDYEAETMEEKIKKQLESKFQICSLLSYFKYLAVIFYNTLENQI